jgi:hypothetical protein
MHGSVKSGRQALIIDDLIIFVKGIIAKIIVSVQGAKSRKHLEAGR